MGEWRMEAEVLAGEHVRLVVAPRREFVPPAYSEFDLLIGLLSNSRELLWRKRDEFPPRAGITFEEAGSLVDELLLIRYGVLGEARPVDPRTGRHDAVRTKVNRTGSSWDDLPKIEAELLPDGRLSLTLGRGELAAFANCVDVAIEELGARSSGIGRSEFVTRTSMTPEEAESFRDELRRLDRETRAEGN